MDFPSFQRSGCKLGKTRACFISSLHFVKSTVITYAIIIDKKTFNFFADFTLILVPLMLGQE